MENNKNISQKQSKTGFKFFIGILVLLIIGTSCALVYDNFLKEKANNSSNSNATTTSKFSYKYFDLELTNSIENKDKIYAIDVKGSANDLTSYDLYVRYQDEQDAKIANIKAKDNAGFEYRTLDLENNKLYFIINSKDKGTIFELHSIDINNLSAGVTNYTDFDSTFSKDNSWKIGTPEEDSIYASQIFVKNSDIFYTSFNDKSLKKYNTEEKSASTVLNNVGWADYFIDKSNSKIFYLNNEKLYLSDISGQNSIEIENKYTGSNFWTKAFYENSPLFEETKNYVLEGNSDVNLYTYDYSSNKFKMIKENIHDNYAVKYNNIETDTTKDSNSYVYSFYVNK